MEMDRDKRVKQNAQISLQHSKLPPRMEAYEKMKKEQQKNNQEGQQVPFSFKPPTPKAVPDFKRLHKQFAYQLERNKSASKLTVPSPFHFHQPKN